MSKVCPLYIEFSSVNSDITFLIENFPITFLPDIVQEQIIQIEDIISVNLNNTNYTDDRSKAI